MLLQVRCIIYRHSAIPFAHTAAAGRKQGTAIQIHALNVQSEPYQWAER